MQFISEQSKLYGWALQASSVKRYSATIGMIILLFLAWYFIVFQRIQALTESRLSAHESHLNQIAQRNQDNNRVLKLNKSIHEIETTIETMVGDASQSDLFQSDIVHLINGGIQLRSYVPGQLQVKQVYNKDVVQLSFDAHNDQLFGMFEQIQQSKNLLCCTQCSITCNNDTNIHSCSCTIERIRLKKVV